jgi:CubicO group peptidase (beta-lactamase class C family)
MILYEEGKFLLDDPISKYLPEFENMKVMIYKDTGELEDAEPIRVKHLLTHTAGLTYEFNRSADPVAQMYMDAGVVAVGYDCEAASLEDWAKRLARQPLIAQPGTRWHYSVAMDLLGRLVEVWSGEPFDVFMRERIFRPLKMQDTAFYAPQEKHDRLATIYRLNEDGQMEVEPQLNKNWLHPPKFPMGGSGLVSTPRDFYRFAQMLVNGGELGGIRVLSPQTVRLMTSDHLPNSMGANPLSGARQVFGDVGDDSDPLDRGVGFGFTGSVLVNQARTNTIGSPGRFGWGGAGGTFFGVDPQEEMVVLFFTQRMGPKYKLRKRLEVLVNQAIVE